jgi:hypothetical protein
VGRVLLRRKWLLDVVIDVVLWTIGAIVFSWIGLGYLFTGFLIVASIAYLFQVLIKKSWIWKEVVMSSFTFMLAFATRDQISQIFSCGAALIGSGRLIISSVRSYEYKKQRRARWRGITGRTGRR